ncbi:MAG: succinate--CoA ligase subunit alpha [Thermoplasmata archaeon]
MSIIVDENTKVLIQGITGHQGTFHCRAMRAFGTKVVGGVTPGKGGMVVEGVPVFNTVKECVEKTGANASVIFVPAPFAKDACYEAIDAGIKVLVVITEHIPFHDTMEVVHYCKYKGVTLIGPNTPGITSVGKTKLGIMPNNVFLKGDTGVVSRSGTLTYEIVNALTEEGIGQTTCVGIGGDPVNGMNFVEILELFEKDPETKRIVLVGEIGGMAEEIAADYIKKHVTKPVYAYIAGRSAPPGKRMGHAGAIIQRGRGTAESKVRALEAAGVKVAKIPADVAKLMKE